MGSGKTSLTRLYRRVMGSAPALGAASLGLPRRRGASCCSAPCSLFYFEFVKVKMLPFDNKSEFQVIVDMPNGTTLEADGARGDSAGARRRSTQPEVVNIQTYAGTASPFNFNGLVRHYYLRRGSNVADIQVNLLAKGERKLQSHEIAKQVRQRLLPIAERYGARIKVAEVPPGPPVLQTLVAEVYGPAQDRTDRASRGSIRDLFGSAPTASWMSTGTWRTTSRSTACSSTRRRPRCNGISEDDIARTLQVASAGYQAGLLHVDAAKEDVPLTVRLDRATRSDLERIQDLKIAGRDGSSVALARTGARRRRSIEDKSIYHKNLMPVTYVTGDVAGAMESPVYAILKLGPEIDKLQSAGRLRHRAAHGARCPPTPSATP